MPRGRGSGSGSLADAFAATHAFGAVGPVKLQYLSKDKFGNSVYKFSYQARRGTRLVTSSSTWAVVRSGGAFKFVAPNSAASRAILADPGQVQFGGSSQRSDLIDRAIAKLGDLVSRGLLTPEQAKTYDFTTWGDTALRIWVSRAGTGNRPGASVIEVEPEGSAESLLEEVFPGFDFGGGGGGGGGGGFAGPVYRAPDRRVVEDFVKGTLVSLVGTVPDYLIGPGVDRFMQDHRANFDSIDKEIDPQMSVLEFVRNTAEYQTIHKLRPDGVDERDWIGQRRQQGERGGLQTDLDQFAINQAAVGGDLQDVERAAATQQFQQSGQMPTLLDNQFRGIAEAMMSRVAR